MHRLIPKQFSLRAFLVLIAIAAGCIWWSVQPSGMGLPQSLANQVKLGMTVNEVTSILPDTISGGGDHNASFLTYRMQGSLLRGKDRFLEVYFKDGKVASLKYYRDPEHAKMLDDRDGRVVPVSELFR